MTLLTYTHEGIFWDSSVRITPRFLSTIVALTLIAPLYVRQILLWSRSLYSILSFVLILIFFASLVEIALGGNGKSSFVLPLLAIAVAMSWLGLREVAGAGWLLVLIAGSLTGFFTNNALGLAGFAYLTFGVLGLSLHSGLSPGHMVSGVIREYKREAQVVAAQIAEDIVSLPKR